MGVAGYYFQQVTGDSGDGATLGDFEYRVAGIGPQVGYLFPLGGKNARRIERQGLLGVRCPEPAGRLEPLVEFRNLAGCTEEGMKAPALTP